MWLNYRKKTINGNCIPRSSELLLANRKLEDENRRLKMEREIQCLSDRSAIYRAKSVKDLGYELNLQCWYNEGL